MTKRAVIILSIALSACVRAKTVEVPQVVHGTASYEVTLFDNFAGANVRACFGGFAPRTLVPIDESAAHGLLSASLNGRPLRTDGGEITLPKNVAGPCIEYAARFTGVMFVPISARAAVVSQSQWMWRPEPFPDQLDTTVKLELPVDAEASLPFPKRGDLYYPKRDAFFLAGYNVFGRFVSERMLVDGTALEIARLEPQLPSNVVHAWLRRAVRVVGSFGGGFPRERLQVITVPVSHYASPVAFGMVRRGGGASVLLLPSIRAELAELEGDWVAIHEFSHLWLPRLYRRDRWLTEGVATYLQEVLRARCGLQSEERAWERLVDGFSRGRRSGTGRTLVEETKAMNRTGAYYRVYWAGTAFALELDVRLRTNSDGSMTLLDAIAAGHQRWKTGPSLMEGREMLAILEEVSGTDFLINLYERYASRVEFPDTSYAVSPSFQPIRRSITSPAPQMCGHADGG